MKTFPLNAWYAAAYDVEVRHALVARTVCDRNLVLLRQPNGRVAALEDGCWHHLLPVGGGRSGRAAAHCECPRKPSPRTIDPAACGRGLPVAEKHRLVWVWPGDPSHADETLVPDLHWNLDPAWAGDGRMGSVQCDYRLLVDHLMDPRHDTFIGGASSGTRAITGKPFMATHTERTATVTRWMENVDAPPFWAAQLARAQGYVGKVDHWHIIRFEAPCTIAVDVGVAPAGSGARKGDRSRGVSGYVLSSVTPSSEHACHHFWACARNYELPDLALTHELREGFAGILREGAQALEAQQQRAIAEHMEHPTHAMALTTGARWARRLIERSIADEQPAQSRRRVLQLQVA